MNPTLNQPDESFPNTPTADESNKIVEWQQELRRALCAQISMLQATSKAIEDEDTFLAKDWNGDPFITASKNAHFAFCRAIDTAEGLYHALQVMPPEERSGDIDSHSDTKDRAIRYAFVSAIKRPWRQIEHTDHDSRKFYGKACEQTDNDSTGNSWSSPDPDLANPDIVHASFQQRSSKAQALLTKSIYQLHTLLWRNDTTVEKVAPRRAGAERGGTDAEIGPALPVVKETPASDKEITRIALSECHDEWMEKARRLFTRSNRESNLSRLELHRDSIGQGESFEKVNEAINALNSNLPASGADAALSSECRAAPPGRLPSLGRVMKLLTDSPPSGESGTTATST